MQTYNIREDKYHSDFIIPGWADRLERSLTIELPEHCAVNGKQKLLDRDEVIEALNKAGVKYNG